MQRSIAYAVLYFVLMILFFIPMYKPFSDMLVSMHSFLLIIYWCVLTVLSIAMGFKALEEMLKGGEK